MPKKVLNRLATAVIGQTTKSFANERGIQVDVVPEIPSMSHLAKEIVDFFQKKKLD